MLTEDGTLVLAEKDGTAIEFRPEIPVEITVQEEPQATPAPLLAGEIGAAPSQEPPPAAASEPSAGPNDSPEPAATESPAEPSVEPAPSKAVPTEIPEHAPAKELLPTYTPAPTQAPAEPPIPTESTCLSDETTVSLKPVSIDTKKIGYSGGTYSAALFESVFDKATNIEFSVLKGGVKENIVINEYLGNHAFSYIIKLTSLTPQKDGNTISFR